MTAVATSSTGAAPETKDVDRAVMAVFAGLMLVIIGLAFIATLFVEELLLRQTAHVTAGRARSENDKEAEAAI